MHTVLNIQSLKLGDAGVHTLKVKVNLPIPTPVLVTCSQPTDLSLYRTILDAASRSFFAGNLKTKLLTTMSKAFHNQTTTKYSGLHSNSWNLFPLPAPSFQNHFLFLKEPGLPQFFVFAFANPCFPLPPTPSQLQCHLSVSPGLPPAPGVIPASTFIFMWYLVCVTFLALHF